MTKGNKILLGVLGAAAAGVVIGLLVAPEKGSDMRKKIKKTANGWADNLSHLFVKGGEAIEEGIEEGKQKAKQMKSAAEEKASRLKEALDS